MNAPFLTMSVLEKTVNAHNVSVAMSNPLKRAFPVSSIEDLSEWLALLKQVHPHKEVYHPLSREAKIFFRKIHTYLQEKRNEYSYRSWETKFQEKAERVMSRFEQQLDFIENTALRLRETVIGDIVRAYGEECFGAGFRFYFASPHDDVGYQSDFIVSGIPGLLDNEFIRIDLKVSECITSMEQISTLPVYEKYHRRFRASVNQMEIFQTLGVRPSSFGTSGVFLQLKEEIVDWFICRFFNETDHKDAYQAFQMFTDQEYRAPILKDSVEDRVGNIILHTEDRFDNPNRMAVLRDFTVKLGELFAGKI